MLHRSKQNLSLAIAQQSALHPAASSKTLTWSTLSSSDRKMENVCAGRKSYQQALTEINRGSNLLLLTFQGFLLYFYVASSIRGEAFILNNPVVIISSNTRELGIILNLSILVLTLYLNVKL